MNYIARAVHAGREVYVACTNKTWHLSEKNANAFWFGSMAEMINVLYTSRGFDIPTEKWRALDDNMNVVLYRFTYKVEAHRRPDTKYSKKKRVNYTINGISPDAKISEAKIEEKQQRTLKQQQERRELEQARKKEAALKREQNRESRAAARKEALLLMQDRQERLEVIRAFLTNPSLRIVINLRGVESEAGMNQNSLRNYLYQRPDRQLTPPTMEVMDRIEKVIERIGFKSQEIVLFNL